VQVAGGKRHDVTTFPLPHAAVGDMLNGRALARLCRCGGTRPAKHSEHGAPQEDEMAETRHYAGGMQQRACDRHALPERWWTTVASRRGAGAGPAIAIMRERDHAGRFASRADPTKRLLGEEACLLLSEFRGRQDAGGAQRLELRQFVSDRPNRPSTVTRGVSSVKSVSG